MSSCNLPPNMSNIVTLYSFGYLLPNGPWRWCRLIAAPPAAPASTRRPQEKENMNDFIAKKREIFLVQMSLDTKRAEITKLEERALQVPQPCFALPDECAFAHDMTSVMPLCA